MVKRYRKPKKRPSKEHQNAIADAKRDDDLDELWDVLSETKGATTWDLPWRTGISVVELCVATNRELAPGAKEFLDIVDELRKFLDERTRTLSQHVYWKMQEALDTLYGKMHYPHERLLYIAARSVQLLISKSDGGGHVYNDLLRELWAALASGTCDKILRQMRCKDALGINPNFDGSAIDDRRRRAFYTAWDRGLYQVAYAVGVR